MTFSAKTAVVGRQAASILEIDLDACSRRYGVSPCTADLALANEILESQTFNVSPWVSPASSITANDSNGPDGTATADKFEITTITSIEKRIYQPYATLDLNQVYTFGLNVRANGVQYVELAFASSGAETAYAIFDVIDGVLCDSGDYAAGTRFKGAKIAYVNDSTEVGYFRIQFSFDTEVVPGVEEIGLRLFDSTFTPAWVGVIGDAVDLWGAQLRKGLFLGRYTPTTTTVVDGMGDVDDLCFNTFDTCQDTANYLKEVKTYRFCDLVTRPTGLIDAYPSIKSVSYGATRIQPGGKFSVRGKVTVVLQDFSDTDEGVDVYAEERTFDQSAQGTFFGKLKERNKFYIGRPMRVLEGYLDPPFSLANFRTREYIIENVTGPDAKGRVTIEGKDVLALARNDRAKAPTASTYTLRTAMNNSQTTMLPQVGEAVDIVAVASDKHFRIDDEIVLIVSESPTDTVNVTRAQGGTTAAAHSVDASIQECLTYEDEPVIDVIDDLLVNFSGIPASFIPTTDWEAEETESLSGYLMETIISTPTGVTKLLQEICEITLIDLWYSDVDQEIKLKLQTPFTAVTETWTDADNLVLDSVKIKDLNTRRLSRVLIYYGIRNFARDLSEPENYQFINFEIEADKEGVNKYDDEKIRTIFSRWFDASNSTQVALTSQRLLDRFGITPFEVTFDIDAKDVETLQTGDVYDLVTRAIQDVNGVPKTTRFQIIETKPVKIGSRYRYISLAFFQDPTPDTLTIAASTSDYDVFVELGGPPGPVDVTLTINAAVDVDGTNGNPAITTVGMHPDSTLRIVNNGDIRGYGGNGGVGKSSSVLSFQESSCIFESSKFGGSAGQAGGDALNATIDVTIDNTNGNIWAGAGGGGGGDSYAFTVTSWGGGGGGGGIGTDTGNSGGGGSGNASNIDCDGPGIEADGAAGVAGSTSAAGAGGAAGGASAGDGGAGGADWGDDGNVGLSGGLAGGVGGFAVRLNGNSITWEGGNTAAKVKGDVA